MELTKVERHRTADAVHKKLRDGIMEGLFKPGERLDISQIARKLGVSPTPVRQAVQMLVGDGFIEDRPRLGTFVAEVSVRDIEENFEVRCALECLAAESAVQNVTREQLEKLRTLLQLLGQPITTLEARLRHYSADAELHHTLVLASGNRLLTNLHAHLHDRLIIAQVHNAYGYTEAEFRQEEAEHEALVTALEQRNAARLKETLQRQLRRAKESLISNLRHLAAAAS